MTDSPPPFPFSRLPDFTFQHKKGRFNGMSLVRHAEKRDGDVCWYCGLDFVRIKKGKKGSGSEPLKRTLEHFIPRKEEGAHTPETTCIAHSICNGRAGDKGIEFRYRQRAFYRANPHLVLEQAVRFRETVLKRLNRKREQKRLANAQKNKKSNDELHAELVRRLAGAAPLSMPAGRPVDNPTTPPSSAAPSSEHPAPLPCRD